MKKAVVRMVILVSFVVGHFILSELIEFPEWFGYAEHFFIGGVVTAWTVVGILRWLDPKTYREATKIWFFLTIIGCCSTFGITWEIFEYWGFQGSVNNSYYYGDTIWDLQMNLLGAFIMVLTLRAK